MVSDCLQLIESKPSRIVWLSSRAAEIGTVDWEDIGLRHSTSSGIREYSTSKLYDLMIAREMARRLEGQGVTVVACHPGLSYTELPEKMSAWSPWRYIAPAVAFFSSQGPARGAISQVHAATADLVKPGGFYGP